MKTRKDLLFFVLAAFFAAAALFHAAAIVFPNLEHDRAHVPDPAWRHALFVAINAAVAAGMLRRPPIFVLAFAALTIQQIVSHGGEAWRAWTLERRIDVTSIGVVILVPLALVALIRDWRARPSSP